MKKEYYIFLILIVAAAVITGSTIGLASNFDLIMKNSPLQAEQMQAEQAQSGQTQTEQLSTEHLQIASIDKPMEDNSMDTTAELAATPNSPSRGGNSPYFKDDLIISPHDRRQILGLLVVLGMIDTNNYDTFLKEFQTQHELNPSGNLDTDTLNHIIEQVRSEKVNR